MKHFSKIDLWVHALIWVVIGVSAFSMFMIPVEEMWIGAIVFLPTVVFMLLLLYNTYYVFEDDYLKCVLGGIPQKIYYRNIKSIRKTNNFLSSAALSADRIEIREKNKGYIRGTTFISPHNKDEFFDELRQRCPRDIDVLN